MLQTHRYELVSVPPAARWSVVGILLENGRRPIEEYLNRGGVDADGFIAFVNLLLTHEPFAQMGKRFKRLRNVSNVFQLSLRKDRFLGFRWERLLVLTNGFRKDAAETPREQIDVCVDLQEKFFSQHPTPGAAWPR